MKRKRLISAVIAAAFVLFVPLISSAQVFTIEGNNFRDANGDLIVGIWGDPMTIIDYDNGDEVYVPLANGILMLAAAAGLYLLAKKKNSRKATMVLAAAMALTLGTTQCNKPKDEESPAGKTIFISLTADNGQTKSEINMFTGRITWETGDKVYVVYDGQLLSEEPLIATKKTDDPRRAEISGSITTAIDIPDHPELTFYYVGSNATFEPVEGSVNLEFGIKEQDGINAGDYMIGRTDLVKMKKDGDKYVPDTPEDKTFRPLTAVLRLDVSQLLETPAGDDVVISRPTEYEPTGYAKNKMKVDLTNGGALSYENGPITFKGSADARVTFFETEPDPETQSVILDFRSAKQGSVEIKGNGNGIERGMIYAKVVDNWSHPIPVEVTTPGADVTAGTFNGEEWTPSYLTGVFSVDNSGHKVRFSKGNLQYNRSTDTWRFAEHQYDFVGGETNSQVHIGTVEGSSNGQIFNADYEGWIDLFGWGTSNQFYGLENNYHPWNWDGSASSYGPSDALTGKSDWGYNAISNGGDTENMGWITLSQDQWKYVFVDRKNNQAPNIGGNKHCYISAIIKVNQSLRYFGKILFPDNFSWNTSEMGAIPAKTQFDGISSSTTPTTFTLEQFQAMEKAGAAFFSMMTGYRSGKQVLELPAGGTGSTSFNSWGYYWSKTQDGNTQAKPYEINKSGASLVARNRNLGYAVRLAMPENF